MRNYKLRLSAMIPSKWFHKLKNMTNLRKKNHPPYSLNTTNKEKASSEPKSLPHPSSSYSSNRTHMSLEPKILQISPRTSLHIIQSKRKSVYKPSLSSSSSESVGFNKNKIKFAHSSNMKLNSSVDDINVNMGNKDLKKNMLKENKKFDSAEKTCPTSKLTVKVKHKEKEEDACRVHKKHQETLIRNGRRSSVNSPGIKLRVSSPRVQVSPRKSKSRTQGKQQVLESFAVIKSSINPKKDFRESMVEMISENNLRGSKDFEDLLACYLSLNPKEYHDLIITVFVKVWFEVISSTFASK